jgi:haloalkane dehalogenase
MTTKIVYEVMKTKNDIGRPDWLDAETFPFESKWINIEGNRIHYIDEGKGPVFLFLHGQATWSFLYRNIIKRLRNRFRCIALDFPGFGLSTAPPDYRKTITDDSRLVELFIQALGLDDITLVVHDLGGSTGLGVVGRYPAWFRGLVIANSFAFSLEDYRSTTRFLKLFGSAFFGFINVNLDLLSHLTARMVNGGKLSKAERRAYLGPTSKSRSSRRYQQQWFKAAVHSGDYLADLEQRLLPLKEMPVLLTFGDQDAAYKAGFMQRFEEMFPNHRSMVIKGSDHFPQEHAPEEIAESIQNWWEEEVATEGRDGRTQERAQTIRIL